MKVKSESEVAHISLDIYLAVKEFCPYGMYSLHMMFQKQRLKPKTNKQTKNGLENLIKSKKKKKSVP